MDIPVDLAERLAALGEKPEQFRDIYESRGAEFFISFLRCHIELSEEALALYREWAPKLQAYAVECRSRNRCPDSGTFSEQDRAKQAIYEARIKSAERLRAKEGAGVIICSIPLIGVPVAQRLWPGEGEPSLILTPEELEAWRGVYKHPEEAHRWWIDYWWNIEDPPDPASILYREDVIEVPHGESPWCVRSGLSWGPQTGGVDIELWSWNGREAKYLRDILNATF